MNKSSREKLEIFVTSNEKLSRNILNMIKSCSRHNITKSLADADLLLSVKNNVFAFSGLSDSFEFKIPSLSLTKQNLTSSFSLLNLYLYKNLKSRDRSRASTNKLFLKTLKKQNQVDKKLHSLNDAELSKKLFYEEIISNTYETSISLADIPGLILKNKIFKMFSTCQIIVHERGQQQVSEYTYDNSVFESSNNFGIKDFNELFSIIKKSKNKLFQSEIFNNQSKIVGTFLAKEFNVEGNNILFVISRNDFIPPSEDEQNQFQSFCEKLIPILRLCIISESIFSRIQKLQLVFDNIHRPVIVNDKNGQRLFTNKAFDLSEGNYNSTAIDRYFKVIPLSRNFNGFVHKYDSFDITSDIYHFQKVSLLGELLNTLQHELSNPLFGIKLSSDLLHTEIEDPESVETLQDISHYASRCQTIIENFSYLYKDELEYQEVDIVKVINETSILTKSETRNIRKTISSNEDSIVIKTNPTWITQIIFNLIINSSQAIKEHSDQLSQHYIKVHSTKSKDKVSIIIEDSGPGISDELSSKLFKPFVTTKEKGTGLGLSICRNLVGKLNGSIVFENNKTTGGAIFKLELPLTGNTDESTIN